MARRVKITGTLKHIPLNRGGYEYGRYGSYYGTGQRLYRYEPDEECRSHPRKPACPCSEKYHEFRASNRKDAIATLREECPKARVRGGRKG